MDRKGGLAYVYSGRLYYRKADGTKQLLLSQGDHPSGIDVVGYISNWGATPFDKVVVEAQNGSGVPVYFTWDGAQLKRLFAAGDTIAGQTSQWARLPAEIAPGEFITHIGGSNWSSISRLTSNGWNTVARNGQGGLNWIQDGFDGGNGYIFFFADRNGQTSLMRSNGSTTDVLASYPSWRDLSQVTAVGGDAAVAYGTLGGSVPQVLRFSGTGSAPAWAPTLTITGPVAAALAQASVMKGLNPSLAHIRTYGDMLLDVTSGGVSPLLKPGDKLPAGNLSSIGAIAANRTGDFAFTAQHGAKTGLFAYKSGQFQIIADADDLIQGSPVYGFATWSDTQVAMNNPGHTAVFTNAAAGNGIYLFTSNAASARNVMRLFGIAPGGSNSFTSVNQIAIDDNDRVAFLANLSNGRTGLFLWDRGTLSELMETGQNDPKGRAYQGFYSLQAAGSKFYVRAAVPSLNEAVVTDGASTQILATDGYITSFNVPVTRFYGAEIAANSRGDVVFPVLTPSGAGLLVKRADGTDAMVVTGNQRGPDDEWFLNVFGAGISEQGDVIFTALGFVGGQLRIAVYQATPL
jgi:hypothetical protein